MPVDITYMISNLDIKSVGHYHPNFTNGEAESHENEITFSRPSTVF